MRCPYCRSAYPVGADGYCMNCRPRQSVTNPSLRSQDPDLAFERRGSSGMKVFHYIPLLSDAALKLLLESDERTMGGRRVADVAREVLARRDDA